MRLARSLIEARLNHKLRMRDDYVPRGCLRRSSKTDETSDTNQTLRRKRCVLSKICYYLITMITLKMSIERYNNRTNGKFVLYIIIYIELTRSFIFYLPSRRCNDRRQGVRNKPRDTM
ncbi:hypothetical protein PUN28_018072 [Cardiocondyla obscurior]|uniref:Uncharacterized protein n=1 Tax=Cardiocondyla obscurior TaxID=286306 RepID=A0AAW2EH60_9HYME